MSSRSNVSPVIGIDLGGTKILVGVVDGNNEILGRSKCPTPAKDGGPAIVAALTRSVEEALQRGRLDRRRHRRRHDRNPRPAGHRFGHDPLELQPERQESADRTPACHRDRPAGPGPQRRPRGRLRRISAGGGAATAT